MTNWYFHVFMQSVRYFKINMFAIDLCVVHIVYIAKSSIFECVYS